MITSLVLHDFKNFEYEALHVGPFTLIVGANASGKSNIRDAFRMIHGIGRGYTFAEIIGGKVGSGGQHEWDPIRGAPHEIARFGSLTFSLRIHLILDDKEIIYFVVFGREVPRDDTFKTGIESLSVNENVIYKLDYSPGKPPEYSLTDTLDDTIKSFVKKILTRDRPLFSQLRNWLSITPFGDEVAAVEDLFANMHFLDLVPERMKQPSFPGQTVLSNNGENLPAVLKKLCSENKRRALLIQWIQTLTPMDVEGFEFPKDPSGRVHLVLREKSGRKISAYSASDGTLRFLAMLAALFGPDPARIYFIEEIDTGIHPSRLHLLVDLIEQQTSKRGIQVIATTHSPALLTIIGDSTFENTSVVCRLEENDDAIIRPVAKIPDARKLRTTQGLGRLLTGGWMETALNLTEGNTNGGEASE